MWVCVRVQVYEALNALGEQGWRINKPVLAVIEATWRAGGHIADLPPLLPTASPIPAPETPRFRSITTPGQLSVAVSPLATALTVEGPTTVSIECVSF